jgi:hypothetical protein
VASTTNGWVAVRRWSNRISAAALVAAVATPGSAEIAIVDAHIGQGDLWVSGQADEPETEIVLDDSFTSRTDASGKFQFRIAYHPATCMVLVKTQRQSRAVAVANCGQRGPPGEPGPPGPGAGPVGAAAPATPAGPGPAADVACAPKSPLYAADNGFKVWVIRRGNLAPGGAEPRIVLQVNIDGSTATTHGPDFARMSTGGPPAQLERQSGGRIAWEGKLGPLPGTIEIVAEGSGGVVSTLRFKECGTPPKGRAAGAAGAEPPPRTPQGDPRADTPRSFPIPQGVFQ